MDIFQYTMKDIGYMFLVVENILQEIFLPRIFFGKPKSLSPIVGTLSMLPVNKSGICLQYPVTSANKKCLILLRTSSYLIGAFIGEIEFSTTYHLLEIR